MIDIDGSHGEGGGQIVRTALALSAVTGQPCRITKIRSGRKEPGLKAQHLAGIQTLSRLCSGRLEGAKPGSTDVIFRPGKMAGGEIAVDVGTAGSISLVLQSLILPALHAREKTVLELRGGTDVAWSPSTMYFQHVFCGFLLRMGASVKMETLAHGFYPKGGGMVHAEIQPCAKLAPLNLTERGKLLRVDVRSVAEERLKEPRVAERQLEGFKKVVKMSGNEFVEYVPSASPGSSMHAHAHYEHSELGADSLGEVGVRAEEVGRRCGDALAIEMDSGACLDRHAADQILPYLALARGGSFTTSEITNHTLTSAHVIEKFLPVKFSIDRKSGLVSCSNR
jgi:RNA 3'-phosphate cyclase